MSTEQRELESRIKTLHKAQGEKAPAAGIIALLEGLKKDVRPTEEMLRTTKAGLVVGKLRGHANKDIGKAANEVVAKWRKIVEEEKKAKDKAKGLTTGGKSGESASPASKAASPAPRPLTANSSSSSKKAYEGDTENRKFTTDKVDVQRTDSKIRNNCIGVLYNGLAYRSAEPEETVLIKAMAVEAAAFKTYKGETQAYKEKVRSLFQNLKVKSNLDLGRNVMSGDITPDRFVVMTSKELMSAEQQQQDAALEAENMKKAQAPMEEKSVSDSLECSGCKQKKVSYSQAQTRSADEPMTTFCMCLNCGKRWKFS